MNFSYSQVKNDLYIVDVDVSGDTSAPFEFCQGVVPQFEIDFKLYAGSTTLTLSATKTIILNVQIIDPIISRISSVTINSFEGRKHLSALVEIRVSFNWSPLGLINPGTNNVILSYSISSTTPVAALTSSTFDTFSINVIEEPDINDPITNSYGTYDGSREIDVCEGTDVTYFATTSDYTSWQFERRYGSGGAWQFITPNPTNVSSFTSTGIPAATGEQIRVTYYRGEWFATSTIYTTNIIPFSGSITLNTSSQTICPSENVEFNVVSAGSTWFHFIKETSGGVTSTVQSSTSSTYSSTTLNDGDKIIVRSYQVSNSTCFATASQTIRVLDLTGANVIGTSKSICYPDPVGTITSTDSSTLSASLFSAGATVTFEWEYNVGGGWVDYGATTEELTISGSLTETTAFRRKTLASLGGYLCEDSSPSNTVTITVNNNAINSFIISSANTSNTICEGDIPSFQVNVDSGSTSPSYTFTRAVSGTNTFSPIAGPFTSTNSYTYTASGITFNDGDQIKVLVSQGGCTVSETIVLESINLTLLIMKFQEQNLFVLIQ